MISYKRATKDDIGQLVSLRLAFIKEVQKIDQHTDDALMKQALYDYFSKTMPNDDFIAWLAYDGDTIVATSGLCFYDRPPSFKNITGKNAYIMNMYTIPAYRKQGIAPVLFHKIIQEAKDLGYEKITLHATEMGRPIYEKYGFKSSHDEMVFTIKETAS